MVYVPSAPVVYEAAKAPVQEIVTPLRPVEVPSTDTLPDTVKVSCFMVKLTLDAAAVYDAEGIAPDTLE